MLSFSPISLWGKFEKSLSQAFCIVYIPLALVLRLVASSFCNGCCLANLLFVMAVNVRVIALFLLLFAISNVISFTNLHF